jgi:hypothetical protein
MAEAGAQAAATAAVNRSSSNNLPIWPSIQEEGCGAAPRGHELEHNLQHHQDQQQQQQVVTLSQQALAQQQQQQQQLAMNSCCPAAAGAVKQQASAEAAGTAVAAARLVRQPIPPVTMVFMLVEGAKVFGQRRKQLLKEVHAQLSQMLMLALKHVPGGYMCRMQVRHIGGWRGGGGL